ncbi:MAG: ATP synthase subunit C [bacterium]|nr:ATP synthase subunit C [bacterium]MDD6224937.1 ATP synthase subunit C [bacterium]MDY3861568.1 ATP synthase subunit C [Ruminococcus sp.]
MTIFDFVMLTLPVIFLVLSVVLAVKAFQNGKSPKKTVYMQLTSFCAVFALCFIFPMFANAAEATASAGGDLGFGLIGAGIATGLSCIGGGIAVGGAAPAAIGATSEDPKNFGKSMIFVALGEGCALYGLLISIMILSKLG